MYVVVRLKGQRARQKYFSALNSQASFSSLLGCRASRPKEEEKKEDLDFFLSLPLSFSFSSSTNGFLTWKLLSHTRRDIEEWKKRRIGWGGGGTSPTSLEEEGENEWRDLRKRKKKLLLSRQGRGGRGKKNYL